MSARPPELDAAARAMVQANADFVLIGGFAVIANRFGELLNRCSFCNEHCPTSAALRHAYVGIERRWTPRRGIDGQSRGLVTAAGAAKVDNPSPPACATASSGRYA